MKRKCSLQKCYTPWCTNQISILENNTNRKKLYCPSCNKEHEISILCLQTAYQKPIKEIILEEAKIFNFKSLRVLSDALDTHISYLRYWIKKYFDCSWDEFRIKYDCQYHHCKRLCMAGVKNKYYILKKLKDKRICSCLTKDNHILVKVKGEDNESIVAEIMDKG